jgi:hypothetical protein
VREEEKWEEALGARAPTGAFFDSIAQKDRTDVSSNGQEPPLFTFAHGLPLPWLHHATLTQALLRLAPAWTIPSGKPADPLIA